MAHDPVSEGRVRVFADPFLGTSSWVSHSFPGAWASVQTRELRRDPIRGHCQVGSLTGAVHLSKNNAGVLRPAQRGQKPRVEQKGKSWLDPGVQYAQGLRKHGLSILLASRV